MFRSSLIAIFIILVLLLGACSQLTTQPAQNATPSSTPPQPELKTETQSIQVEVPTQTVVPQITATNLPNPEPTVIPEEPTLTATEMPTAEPSAAAIPVTSDSEDPLPSSSDCEDKAAFYDDVTIPDDTPFEHSETFEKIWRIRNEGTCTWEGYQLVWAGGSIFDAPLSNPIPMTRPGELVEIPVVMRSPNQGGLYTSYWEFENTAGQRFGVNSGGVDLIWVRISVTWYPEGSTSPGASSLPASAGDCSVEQNTAYVDQLFALINSARQQNGLPALTLDPRLSAAAFAHSSDMACKDFVDHTGSNGSGWADRIKTAGYAFSYATENIYVGNPDFGGGAQGAFDWWMNSEIHRNNILSTKVSQIGIGYAFNANSTYKGHYTLNFARP